MYKICVTPAYVNRFPVFFVLVFRPVPILKATTSFETIRPMLRFDHAVLVVADLPSAVQRFTTLGFTVAPGGMHAGGRTCNALIGLAEGGYLELLAAAPDFDTRRADLDGLDAFARRFVDHVRGEPGPVDFALRCDDLAAETARLRAAGLPVEGPFPGSRVRPDGVRLAWQIALPDGPGLPFLIADTTPRERRVPDAPPHANGVCGLDTLTAAAADLDASTERYRRLLGPPESVDPPVFRIGTARLRLVSGPADAVLHDLRLTTRGGSARRLCLGHADRYDLLPCPESA